MISNFSFGFDTMSAIRKGMNSDFGTEAVIPLYKTSTGIYDMGNTPKKNEIPLLESISVRDLRTYNGRMYRDDNGNIRFHGFNNKLSKAQKYLKYIIDFFRGRYSPSTVVTF